MGGSNEKRIAGLRVHIKNNNIHLHDDTKSLKFELNFDTFNQALQDAFEVLNQDDDEGLYEINGNQTVLCLFKHKKGITMFIRDDTDIEQEFTEYIDLILHI